MSESVNKYFATAYRTHTNGELNEKNEREKVTLSGWVQSRRDHGGLIFIDLRDRWGVTQLTVGPEHADAWKTAEGVRNEYVIRVTGTVKKRPAEMVNEKLPSGKIEVEVEALEVMGASQAVPFAIDSDAVTNEEIRLQYRYLDLRRPRLQGNILLRHQMLQAIRTFFYQRDFVEIETPILIKGTPEGAREYVVPSRLYPGKFYVLPQSPQQLKQLSMVAGFDRYMQVARCFRDEDQRGDRQPEFTQVDIEMSFVEASDIMALTEACLKEITQEFRPEAATDEPFRRLTWDEAMHTYGSDKPDLRFELAFVDVTELCRDCDFSIFAEAVKKGGVVKALRLPQGASLSRKEIDDLTATAKAAGAGGLAWIKVGESEHEGVPVKKLGNEVATQILAAVEAEAGDLVVFTADTVLAACQGLGAVRLKYAVDQGLTDSEKFAYCWVTDFPLFERDQETDGISAVHHPFTRPLDSDLEHLESDPLKAKAQAYDIVLNGYEIGGGSIRIHERDIQERIFTILGISAKQAEQRFGHLLKAFSFGAPPHGGIAWGFDRLVMLFAGEPNIREVIAYPKDQKAKDVLLGAPAPVDRRQLKDLHIVLDLGE